MHSGLDTLEWLHSYMWRACPSEGGESFAGEPTGTLWYLSSWVPGLLNAEKGIFRPLWTLNFGSNDRIGSRQPSKYYFTLFYYLFSSHQSIACVGKSMVLSHRRWRLPRNVCPRGTQDRTREEAGTKSLEDEVNIPRGMFLLHETWHKTDNGNCQCEAITPESGGNVCFVLMSNHCCQRHCGFSTCSVAGCEWNVPDRCAVRRKQPRVEGVWPGDLPTGPLGWENGCCQGWSCCDSNLCSQPVDHVRYWNCIFENMKEFLLCTLEMSFIWQMNSFNFNIS